MTVALILFPTPLAWSPGPGKLNGAIAAMLAGVAPWMLEG